MDPSLNNESRAEESIVTVSVCLSLVTIVVALRIYTRLCVVKQFGMDDYAAVVSWVFTMACGLVIALSVPFGAGRHIWILQQADVQEYLKLFYLSIVFYNLSIMATKASFLFSYARILAINRRMRLIFLWSIVIIGTWCAAFVLLAIFQCSPIWQFWMLAVDDPSRHCIPHLPYWHIQGAGHIFTDLVIFVLPLPALIKLRMNRTRKVLLIGVFSLGFFTCAISIIRLPYLRMTDDLTWDNIPSSLWSVGEVTAGLVCASLPSLRPLLGKVAPGLSSSLSGVPSHSKQPTGSGPGGAGARPKTKESSSSGGTHARSRSSVERLQGGGSKDLEMGMALGMGVPSSPEKRTHSRLRSENSLRDDLSDDSSQHEVEPRGFHSDEKRPETSGFGLRGIVVTEVSVGSDSDRGLEVPAKDDKPYRAHSPGGIQVVRDIDIVRHTE